MLSKLTRLFHRYCDCHLAIYAPGFPVFDASGEKIGQVERICYGRAGSRLEGWAVAEQISLNHPGQYAWKTPDILRADVNATLGLDPEKRTGFNLSLMGDPKGAMMCLRRGKDTLQITCPSVGRMSKIEANLHIRVSFARALIRAFPALIKAFFAPSVSNRHRVKRILGMDQVQLRHVLDSGVFEKGRPIEVTQKVTLILPVFNAFEVLQDALSRIVKNTDLPWRLILIEDCSTDARIRPMLRAWSEEHQSLGCEIELLENPKNLGFIGSVNKAFAVALEHGDHAVLINSDALVPEGWATRILSPIVANSRVASVTPLSNDAEIYSTPQICAGTQLQPGIGDKIDADLKANLSSSGFKAAPTGVGFCMAMNIEFLRKLPTFDEAFGKGYGEEVDWCQKAKALGGVHMCQPNLFVEHRGGASFGSKAKQLAIAKNNQVISVRYPNYDMSVQRFIAVDPLRSERLFAAISNLAASQDSVSIYVVHSLGGGAELYLQEKLAQLAEINQGALIIRIGGATRWRIELHSPQGNLHGETEDTRLIHLLMSPIKARHLIYSCAVGDPNPLDLTQVLLDLVASEETGFSFLIHDYFSVSPSYCLLDTDNEYRGLPSVKNSDPRHCFKDTNGAITSLAQWRGSWGAVLASADRIVCFSKNSSDLMAIAYPKIEPKLELKPHDIAPISHVHLPSRAAKPSIGVLGHIGLQKGAKIISQMADHISQSDFQNIVVVGCVDPQFPLNQNCIETGSYQRSEITSLAQQHNIHAWFIPSIWPETFSYTTHEALATGLPVFAFDIGAQGDAVREATNGTALPFDLRKSPEELFSQIQEVLVHGATRESRNFKTKASRNRGFAA